jgi:hypothetical protein
MMITFTAVDLRDPMESDQVYFSVEGPVEPEDGGWCYCHPVRLPPGRSDDTASSLPIHLHLKIWGACPEASPRYYEMPIR